LHGTHTHTLILHTPRLHGFAHSKTARTAQSSFAQPCDARIVNNRRGSLEVSHVLRHRGWSRLCRLHWCRWRRRCWSPWHCWHWCRCRRRCWSRLRCWYWCRCRRRCWSRLRCWYWRRCRQWCCVMHMCKPSINVLHPPAWAAVITRVLEPVILIQTLPGPTPDGNGLVITNVLRRQGGTHQLLQLIPIQLACDQIPIWNLDPECFPGRSHPRHWPSVSSDSARTARTACHRQLRGLAPKWLRMQV
jgi:hypothetical protein